VFLNVVCGILGIECIGLMTFDVLLGRVTSMWEIHTAETITAGFLTLRLQEPVPLLHHTRAHRSYAAGVRRMGYEAGGGGGLGGASSRGWNWECKGYEGIGLWRASCCVGGKERGGEGGCGVV